MNPDFQEIRTIIERRYRRRIHFVLHFTLFILAAMVTTWYMLTQYGYTGNTIPLTFMGGWAMFLAFHRVYVRLANARDQEIESAWERIYGKFSPDAAPSEQITSSAPNRLRLVETQQIEDEWVEEKPKRTLHEE